MPRSKKRNKDDVINVYRINIKSERDKNKVKLSTTPKVEETNLDELQYLLNVLITGVSAGLDEMLGGLPILRPASDIEREANVYIFKDIKRDNDLYKQRKALHDSIADVFNASLKRLFPDVEYINSCQTLQQELVFDMSAEEAEEHNESIKEIAKKVREEKSEPTA